MSKKNSHVPRVGPANPSVVATAVASQHAANQQPATLAVREEYTVATSGPLPSASELAAYNSVLPDAAERIFALTETEQTHRHQMERQVTQANIQALERQLDIAASKLKAETRLNTLGMVLGWSVSLVLPVAAIYLAMHGHDNVAIAVAVINLGAVIEALRRTYQTLATKPEHEQQIADRGTAPVKSPRNSSNETR